MNVTQDLSGGGQGPVRRTRRTHVRLRRGASYWENCRRTMMGTAVCYLYGPSEWMTNCVLLFRVFLSSLMFQGSSGFPGASKFFASYHPS